MKNCGGKTGHDLLELKNSILNSFFSTHNIPALHEDIDFLKNDEDIDRLIHLLSEFGKCARYYNLDIVTSAANPAINVKVLWENYETSIVTSNPELMRKLEDVESGEEVLDYTKRIVIIKLEKFARAICRQFTIGRLGKKALKFSSALYSFIMLHDNELGNRNYRKETSAYQEKERKVHKRGFFDELQRITNKRYRHMTIKKEDFNGDWPFYHNEVVIECREKYWCVVTIDGKDYALNGSAKGRYKLEGVHEAGMAILGKSIGPFIDMALKLGEDV